MERINTSDLQVSSSDSSWTVTSFDHRLDNLEEDRMGFELTDEDCRKELSKQL